MRALARHLWRFLRGVLLVFAALIVFLEEFGWRPLSAFLGLVAQWPPFHWIEGKIKRLPARWALTLFLVPAVLLFPVKLAALGLIHRGHAAIGVAVIIGAKVVGTAIVGRLFVLLEPQLMEFSWFVRALSWWRKVKEWVGTALRVSPVWRTLRAAYRNWRGWLQRRLR
ncbi:MAG: hypothetical protein ABIV63_09080 [Caldimonas sp.]